MPVADIKTIPPRSGAGFTLDKGQTLTVIDPEGRQVSDLLAFNRGVQTAPQRDGALGESRSSRDSGQGGNESDFLHRGPLQIGLRRVDDPPWRTSASQYRSGFCHKRA